MTKLKTILCLLTSVFLAMFFCLYSISLGYCIPDNGYFDAPYSSNIPNIDGQWSTPTEWTDASETRVEDDFGWRAYFRLKHNQTHIFVLLDFITDQSESANDLGGVCIDTLDEGGNAPKTDDYVFGYRTGWGSSVFQGTGHGGTDAWVHITTPSGTLGVGGFSSINDPYEGGKDHRIYEFQVPCSFLGEENRYGFYAYVCDNGIDTLLEWPEGAGGLFDYPDHFGLDKVPPAPGNWGSIGGNFIPEFPSFLILPLFMIATLLTVIIYKRKHTR